MTTDLASEMVTCPKCGLCAAYQAPRPKLTYPKWFTGDDIAKVEQAITTATANMVAICPRCQHQWHPTN